MELTTSIRFFKMVETLSPAEVLRLALAVRAGSSAGAGVTPPCPANDAHERAVLLPAGAGSGDGVQGEPGTVGAWRVPAHETGPPGS